MVSNEDHWRQLIELSSPGGPLSQANSKASLRVREWYSAKGRPHEVRDAVRRQIAALVNVETDSQNPPTAILMAGPPGSGKSSALHEALTRVEYRGGIRVIDADRIKDEFLVASMRDGTLHTILTPPGIANLTRDGLVFHPRELSTLVHSESAFFAERLAERAVLDRQSFVLDATMQNANRAVERVTALKKAGYQVSIVEVACSRDQALHRTTSAGSPGENWPSRPPPTPPRPGTTLSEDVSPHPTSSTASTPAPPPTPHSPTSPPTAPSPTPAPTG